MSPTLITFEEAWEKLSRDDSCILLDVRDEAEYLVGHAEGAQLLPMHTITADTAAETIPSPETPVITYCKSGRRSHKAAAALTELGYLNVYDLGSLVGWPYGIEQGD